jgi:hypothetical protein
MPSRQSRSLGLEHMRRTFGCLFPSCESTAYSCKASAHPEDPSRNTCTRAPHASQRLLRRAIPENRLRVYDIRKMSSISSLTRDRCLKYGVISALA